MEIKKNPKYDLRRSSMIFFQIGMIVMLFFTWRAMEWTTQDKAANDTSLAEIADDLEEVIPVTEPIDVTPPPPPPPQVAPEVIVAVDNDLEVEETVIESSETNQDDQIYDIAEIVEEAEEEEVVNIPFAVIEEVPIYPGCEDMPDRETKKNCMSEKVMAYVQRNFNTELATDLGLEGRQRINVQFKINKYGDVCEVRARAPHPRLEEEAVNLVSGLPKMKPGMQRGEPVGVIYALPILFQVEN